MIDAITAVGVNGTQVQINLSDNIYPLEHFEPSYDVQSDDQPKMQEHGSWPSPDYIGNAHLLLEGSLLATSAADFWPKRMKLMAPFAPLPQQGFNETTQLIMQLTGWGDTLECMCNLDGAMPSIPITSEIPAYGSWQINLKMRDPRFYQSSIQNVTLQAPVGGLGVTFPVTFPVAFSGVTPSQGHAFNAGNAYSDPTWTITGPCNNPRLFVVRANGTTETWSLTGIHIPDGSTVVVNFKEKTVVQDNSLSLYRYVSSSSTWWQLYNGDNIVGFTAINSNANCTGTCSWQSAYFL